MIILALLLGALLGPIGRQVDQSQVNATERQLADIKDALLGHLVINRQLPCPDVDGDGVEDRVPAGSCSSLLGWLPWTTLNVPEADAWNTRFRYRVSDQFTVATTMSPMPSGYSGLSLATATSGNIVINQRAVNKSSLLLAGSPSGNPPGVAAVVLSFGKNTLGGTMAGGTARQLPTNNDETLNAAASAGASVAATFIIRTPKDEDNPCSDTAGTTPMCAFDDQLIWLSANTIISRLVIAGRIP